MAGFHLTHEAKADLKEGFREQWNVKPGFKQRGWR